MTSSPKPMGSPAISEVRSDDGSALFLRAQRGDEAAFRAWVSETIELVHRVVMRWVGRGEVDDVVQETYVKAWRSIHKVRKASAARAWLCKIARNTANDAVRKNKRAPVSLESNENWGERFSSSEPLPDTLVSSQEARALVHAALARMKPIYRAVLTLRELDGLSEAETAEVLGIAIGTVGSRLARAKKMLAKSIKVECAR